MNIRSTLMTAAATLAYCTLAMPAQAQDAASDRFARSGSEVRLSLSVPLGATPDKLDTTPRVSLGVRQYEPAQTASSDWMRQNRSGYRETRLGFTLDSNPQFLLNGGVLETSMYEDQANIGTAGKIGLGVTAVALTGVALLAILIVACDADDCWDDEE